MSNLNAKIEESHEIIAKAVETFRPKAVMALFSGGNDSAGVLNLVAKKIHAVVHCNTEIGIEETRIHVRKTCADIKLKLIEERPLKKDSYPELVKEFGFPGPDIHRVAYSRLKERQLRRIMKRTLGEARGAARKDRIIFIAGIRGSESARRARYAKLPTKGVVDRIGRMVFVSPIYNWTREDLDEYRDACGVVENPVSAKIHMSGECLCGSYAHPGEREEIKFWYPEFIKESIVPLEKIVKAKWGDTKPCVWGPSQFGKVKTGAKAPGIMCHDCTPKLADMARGDA